MHPFGGVRGAFGDGPVGIAMRVAGGENSQLCDLEGLVPPEAMKGFLCSSALFFWLFWFSFRCRVWGSPCVVVLWVLLVRYFMESTAILSGELMGGNKGLPLVLLYSMGCIAGGNFWFVCCFLRRFQGGKGGVPREGLVMSGG